MVKCAEMACEYGGTELNQHKEMWGKLTVAVRAKSTNYRLLTSLKPEKLILVLLLALTPHLAEAAERCLGTPGATPVYSVDVVPQRAVLDLVASITASGREKWTLLSTEYLG